MSGLSRRMTSVAEPARFRRGSRTRTSDSPDTGDIGQQAETLASPADTAPTGPRRTDNGFWADLFPGSDRTKDGT
jgi:hypothetical protein